MTRRHDKASVTALLVDEGADPGVASEIVETLTAAGLSFAEARAWLAHPDRAYPIATGEIEIAGIAEPLRQTPIFAIEDGHEQHVLAAARQFEAASTDERAISRLFGSDVDDARRLTGGDAARAAVVARIAQRLLNALRKPEHVTDVAQTLLPDHDGRRMVDLIVTGREDDLLAELADGRIDPQRLLDEGELELHGW